MDICIIFTSSQSTHYISLPNYSFFPEFSVWEIFVEAEYSNIKTQKYSIESQKDKQTFYVARPFEFSHFQYTILLAAEGSSFKGEQPLSAF